LEPLTDDQLSHDIMRRLRTWYRWNRIGYLVYALLGGTSILASTLAATKWLETPQYASAVSAFCIGLLGFVNPQRRAARFIRAWRVVDGALWDFRYGNLPRSDLLKPVREGERIIDEGAADDVGMPKLGRPKK
jgi:hypothetical protein